MKKRKAKGKYSADDDELDSDWENESEAINQNFTVSGKQLRCSCFSFGDTPTESDVDKPVLLIKMIYRQLIEDNSVTH